MFTLSFTFTHILGTVKPFKLNQKIIIIIIDVYKTTIDLL